MNICDGGDILLGSGGPGGGVGSGGALGDWGRVVALHCIARRSRAGSGHGMCDGHSGKVAQVDRRADLNDIELDVPRRTLVQRCLTAVHRANASLFFFSFSLETAAHCARDASLVDASSEAFQRWTLYSCARPLMGRAVESLEHVSMCLCMYLNLDWLTEGLCTSAG